MADPLKPSNCPEQQRYSRAGDVAYASSVPCRAGQPDISESIVNSSPGPSTSPGKGIVPLYPREHASWSYRQAVTWLVIAFTAGSCGYHLAGRADTVPDTVHTIAIPTFRNNTTEFKIEQHLTSAVAREFMTRTRYRIVADQLEADATLTGTVLNFFVFPAVFDRTTGRATSVATLTQVHVALVERNTGKVIYQNPAFEYRERYEVTTDAEAYLEERPAALARTGEGLARSLVSAVLEGF